MKINLFKPHRGQRRVVDEFVLSPDLEPNEGDLNLCHWGIVVCGRQWGKTLLAMNAMLKWALSRNNSYCVWLTPYDRQGDSVYDELGDAASSFIKSKNSQKKEIYFKNGSVLLFRSLENYEAVRGYTFDYGVIDECAFVREEAWKVVRPVFAVNGKKVLVISTPWVKNAFHKMYNLGLDPSRRDFISFQAKSTDNPYFPKAELEGAREVMSDDQIKMEYLAEFGEAGGGVFKDFFDHCNVEEFKSDYREQRCYIGVDIALGGKDFTTVVIMNQSGKVINVERWQDSITSRQISRLEMIIASYDIAGGYIEMNQERGIAQAINKLHPLIKPWETTRKSKPQLIQNLKKDIEDGKLQLPTRELCPTMFLQLGDFTKTEMSGGYIKYSHPDGGHDDDVIALALAAEARDPNRYQKFTPKYARFGESKRRTFNFR